MHLEIRSRKGYNNETVKTSSSPEKPLHPRPAEEIQVEKKHIPQDGKKKH